MPVFAVTHALQSRTGLALRAGADYHQFGIFHCGCRSYRHKSTFGYAHEAVADSHFQCRDHAAAVHGYFFTVMDRGVDDHLDPIHVSAEQTDKDTARRVAHDVFETLLDSRFGRRPPQAL